MKNVNMSNLSLFVTLTLIWGGTNAFAVDAGQGAMDHNRQDYQQRASEATIGNVIQGAKKLDEAAAKLQASKIKLQQGAQEISVTNINTLEQKGNQTDAAKIQGKAGKTTKEAKAEALEAIKIANEASAKSKQANSEILRDTQKVKSDKARNTIKGIFQSFGKSFAGLSLGQIEKARAKIAEGWNKLNSEPEILQAPDGSKDAYINTANLLNARELELTAAEQKGHAEAASTILDKNANQAEANAKNLGETKGSGMPSMPSVPSAPGGGGAGGSAASIPQVGDSGISQNDDVTSTGNTEVANPNSLAKSDKSGNSELNKFDLGTTALGNSSNGSGLSGSGSSRYNANYRASLKKRLLGADAEGGGGSPTLSASTDPEAAKAQAAAAGIHTDGALLGDAGGGGGGAGAAALEDFTMPRSETDAAVKNLLTQFGSNGPNADTEWDGQRGLASEGIQAGIDGQEGPNLFVRIRSAVSRQIKKGHVVNGINGKI